MDEIRNKTGRAVYGKDVVGNTLRRKNTKSIMGRKRQV